VIAFGKLAGLGKHFRLFSSAPVVFKGQHMLNALMALAMIGFGAWFFMSGKDGQWLPFIVMLTLAFVLGVLIIIPIGGADMPVVISMLNSYSGWAAAGIGFSLNNPMLIIAGSLVGSSGAILSYIMCKAMNRSFFNVILGGFGAAEGAAAASGEARPVRAAAPKTPPTSWRTPTRCSSSPGTASRSRARSTPVKELADKLIEKGVTVKYAVHPVAGRMPGHMNVLLAEAEVPYDLVFEMEDINSEFGMADVALILGANDVVNPLALKQGSPIYGMPDPRRLQGEDRDREQALDGDRLRRSRQRALLHGQDHDGLRRREEGRRGNGEGDSTDWGGAVSEQLSAGERPRIEFRMPKADR